MTKRALILIDFINDIIHPEGKLAGKGYSAFSDRFNTLSNAKAAMDKFSNAEGLVIHVKVGFSADYIDQPKNSPLFGKADEFDCLKMGTWGTEIVDFLEVANDANVHVKNRVSAFYGTGLKSMLHREGITDVYIAGVATDLAVEASARDAHDRDYNVYVLADCCAAANEEDHNNSLKTISKIAKVINLSEVSV